MKTKNKNSDQHMAHVLYQKLGASWYAFTELDGEMFIGKVDEEKVPEEMAQTEAQNFVFAEPRKNLKAA